MSPATEIILAFLAGSVVGGLLKPVMRGMTAGLDLPDRRHGKGYAAAVALGTGLLFAAVAWKSGGAAAMPYGLLVALLVTATCIDLDHQVIPNQVTWGGAIAGLALSPVFPAMHGTESGTEALLLSAAGAATGFALLWGIAASSKLFLGRRTITYAEPVPFTWRRTGDSATLEIAGRAEPWEEFFPSERAVLRLQCTRFEFGGTTLHGVKIRSRYQKLALSGTEHDLDRVDTFSGELSGLAFERDTMGLGDVKFMACIGAFLGWEGALWTIVGASLLGSIVGIAAILVRRRDWGSRIPFGPYLSAGAVLWILAGPPLVSLWMALFTVG